MRSGPRWPLRLAAAALGLAICVAWLGPVWAAPTAGFSLRWAVQRQEYPPQADTPRSLARFTLIPAGNSALPARGWALYFTCIAGVVTGPTAAGYVVEQVAGTLYRLRPGPGFRMPAGGQALQIDLVHPEPMFKADKAPQGPYLVLDTAADEGLAIADYRIETLTRPEQLATAAGQRPARVDPDEIYALNARAPLLPAAELPPLFPTPRHLQRRQGSLQWVGLPDIKAPQSLQHEALQAGAWLQPFFAADAGPRSPALRLRLGKVAGQTSPEAYSLDIDPARGVTITGASAAGVVRGLQSLRDLLPLKVQPAQGVTLPALHVLDAPRFEHRGVMLDVARNFHTKATVLRLLDLMARLKLNTLHLHLTDDEGWRLAIPGLPELTDFGARRGHSSDPGRHLPPAYGSGPDVGNPDGSGHYSAADYIDIVRHAAALHIQVVPEIEMPGHARAAVKAMDARSRRLAAAGNARAQAFSLQDPADRSIYRSAQLYADHLMDPGLESTYTFVEHVVAELVRLHRQAGVPLRQLHVGADELPAGAWTASPAAQARIQQLGLHDSAGLWNYFYDRVGRILQGHGVAAGGWEELGARRAQADGGGPLVPNAHFLGRGHTLYVWNNLDDADDLAYRLANAGYRVVLAPATTLYFDMAANRDPDEPGVNWAAYIDLDTVFDHVPLDQLRKFPTVPAAAKGKAVLTARGRRNIVGLEATLFSETLRGAERLEFMLLPRLLGLAERAWAPDPSWATERNAERAAAWHARAWTVFANQAGQQVLPRLQRDLPGLSYRIAAPGLRRDGDTVHINHALPGLTLRYALDGSDPSADSTIATGPILARGPLRAAAFDAYGHRGAVASVPAR